MAQQLNRYNSRIEQYRMFKSQPGIVYSEPSNNYNMQQQPIPCMKMKNLESNPKAHNHKAPWIRKIISDHENIPPMAPSSITIEQVKSKLSSMSNWKAPGPDMVHKYWIKEISSLH
jgi:hypothetical protein